MPRACSFALILLFLLSSAPLTAGVNCAGTVYLTLDTGTMSQAEHIAQVLNARNVKATFFIANEKTFRGDYALDTSWTDYWQARVREGHAFGSHTWRHWYLRSDLSDDSVLYVAADGSRESLDKAGFCRELKQVDVAFHRLTGHNLDGVWRAPGGRTTPRSLEWAAQCGFPQHVAWAPAGFLGDELASETYPNRVLLRRALSNVRDGDILMMHLGIRSRREPFALVFEDLIKGLQERRLCFAKLPRS